MKRLMGMIALLSVSSQGAAQIGVNACLTSDQAEGLITYALPSIINGMTKQCIASLPATSALTQSGAIIAGRYQDDAVRAWPIAQSAIDTLIGLQMAALMGEPAAKKLIQPMMAEMLAQKIKASDCPKIDRFMNLLQPLPAKNMAGLIVALLEFGGNKDGKSPVKLCPTPNVAGK